VKDFLLEAALQNGRLAIKVLRAAALGGDVIGSGSSIDWSGARPRFALRARLARIELAQVLALLDSELRHHLDGRGSLELDVKGQGASWPEVVPHLNGTLALSLTEGRLQSASLATAVTTAVINPLLSQLHIGSPLRGGSVQQRSLRELSAQFRIAAGQLHTMAPLRYTSEEGSLSLQGSIGLAQNDQNDHKLALTGDFLLAPRAIAAATGGRLVPDTDIPIGLRVGGSLTRPDIGLVDPLKALAALTASLVRGQGAAWLKSRGFGDFFRR